LPYTKLLHMQEKTVAERVNQEKKKKRDLCLF
jgi:hypothetical protein